VVPFTEIGSTPNNPKCINHVEKKCELFCEKCDVPVCSTCISSGQHGGHRLSEILKTFSAKAEGLRKDLEELKTRIHPQYEEMASNIQTNKAEIDEHYEKLTTEAEQQGEVWHQKITAIVNHRKSGIEEMKNKHLAVLNKHAEDITHSIAKLKQVMQDLKRTLHSNDLSLVSSYKSRNEEFRCLPPKLQVKLPIFESQELDTDQLDTLFGSLTSLSITTEENDEKIDVPEADSLADELMRDEPQLVHTINTGFEPRGVTSLSDEKIWTCGDNSTMKLFNLQGRKLKSILARERNEPGDISVTRDGDLLFTERESKTINIVKNLMRQTLIRLRGWTPLNICCTSTGSILVSMASDSGKPSRVILYSGSKPMRTIQADNNGRPLYSVDGNTKYICENRNLDICVADTDAKAVVVVDWSGKFRFRYTGHPTHSKESFYPLGITTDSKGHILTTDCVNACIHMLDQDGRFLRYIDADRLELRLPWGLCTDTKDNLFVAELSGKVKKIKY
jgi:hypothetical protein